MADWTKPASDSAILKSLHTLIDVQKYTNQGGEIWLSPSGDVQAAISNEMYVFSPLHTEPVVPIPENRQTAMVYSRRLDVQSSKFDQDKLVPATRIRRLIRAMKGAEL